MNLKMSSARTAVILSRGRLVVIYFFRFYFQKLCRTLFSSHNRWPELINTIHYYNMITLKYGRHSVGLNLVKHINNPLFSSSELPHTAFVFWIHRRIKRTIVSFWEFFHIRHNAPNSEIKETNSQSIKLNELHPTGLGANAESLKYPCFRQ